MYYILSVLIIGLVYCQNNSFDLEGTRWKVVEIKQAYTWQNYQEVFEGLSVQFKKDNLVEVEKEEKNGTGIYEIWGDQTKGIMLSFVIEIRGTYVDSNYNFDLNMPDDNTLEFIGNLEDSLGFIRLTRLE